MLREIKEDQGLISIVQWIIQWERKFKIEFYILHKYWSQIVFLPHQTFNFAWSCWRWCNIFFISENFFHLISFRRSFWVQHVRMEVYETFSFQFLNLNWIAQVNLWTMWKYLLHVWQDFNSWNHKTIWILLVTSE